MGKAMESERAKPSRIVVVDDDPLVLRALASMLESSGYEALTLEDGSTAPSVVEEQDIDLVILDIMMPGLSGLECCRRIKQSARGRRTPVVLLTALGAPEDVITGIEAGADEFLSKPIEPQVLAARVGALLRFQRAQRQDGTVQPTPSLPELLGARVRELSDAAGLSPREREVLDLLLLGRTMDEIGVALSISPRTAKFHQANLIDKLGAESRLDLLRLIL